MRLDTVLPGRKTLNPEKVTLLTNHFFMTMDSEKDNVLPPQGVGSPGAGEDGGIVPAPASSSSSEGPVRELLASSRTEGAIAGSESAVHSAAGSEASVRDCSIRVDKLVDPAYVKSPLTSVKMRLFTMSSEDETLGLYCTPSAEPPNSDVFAGSETNDDKATSETVSKEKKRKNFSASSGDDSSSGKELLSKRKRGKRAPPLILDSDAEASAPEERRESPKEQRSARADRRARRPLGRPQSGVPAGMIIQPEKLDSLLNSDPRQIDYGKLLAGELLALGIKAVEEIEEIRGRSKNIQGSLNGRLKRRVPLIGEILRSLANRVEDRGDSPFLSMRVKELDAQLREANKLKDIQKYRADEAEKNNLCPQK